MNCPHCGHENDPSNSFCINCGTRLPDSIDVSAARREIQELRQLLDKKYDDLHRVNQRLAALEAGLSRFTEIGEAEIQTAAEEEITHESIIREAADEIAYERPEPVAEKKVEIREPVQAAVPPEIKVEDRREHHPGEWEQILGGNWLARIGIFALLIATGFLLKYSYDRNWISPTVLVILIGLGGFAFMGLGHLSRNKYPVMTQVLTGGGIAVWFLALYAGSYIYDVIPYLLAVFLLLGTCAVSVFFALRYNSMALVILGLIGAYLAPLLIGLTGTAGINAVIAVPVYLIVVNIAVLYISTMRNWRWFTVFSFAFTALILWITYEQFGSDAGVPVKQTLLTLIFLIFVGTTILYNVIWHKVATELDYLLMMLNAFFYFGFSYYVMWDSLQEWMGLFSLLVALFYGGLFYLVRKRGRENDILSLFSLGIALVFLTIAVPIQIGNSAWTTVAWAAQGTVLIWLSLKNRMPLLLFLAYPAFTLMAGRLLFFDSIVSFVDYFPVFNQRGLAFLACIAFVYFTVLLIQRYKDSLFRGEKAGQTVFSGFMILANILTMWFIGAEVITFAGRAYTGIAGWPLVFLMVLAGATTLQYLFWRRRTERFDFILLVINFVFYVAVSTELWDGLRDWMGCLYFILSFICFGLFYGTLKRKDEAAKLNTFGIVIGIILFTAAIPVQIGNQVWTTVAWAGEFLLLLCLANMMRFPLLRYFGYGAFVITVGKILILDTAVSIADFHPVLNERFLSYAVVIAATYFGMYLLWRNRDNDPDWHIPSSTFLIVANFLTLWLLSFEIWNYFDARILTGMDRISAHSAQNLSLTALWLVYAVALLAAGIFRRSRILRLGGLILIGVSILKVFVYDVFNLQMVYRIVAFVCLGVLLLAGGFLYQRYSNRIKDFLIK